MPADVAMPPGARAPRWARVMDAAVPLLILLALFVALAGRSQLTRYGVVTLPETAQLLFAAGACLLVRHVACPSPSIASTFRGWRDALHRRPDTEIAVRAFVFTRPMVFLVAYFAVVTIGIPERPAAGALSPDPLANLPARFDAGWYGSIARTGYAWSPQYNRQQNIAFFPAFPMLMRPVGSFFGANNPTLPGDKRMLRMLWGGVVVSLASFLWGLYYFARLSRSIAGPETAAAAPLLLAAYPFATFFSAPYTESLFLLASVATFYHFHRGDWWRASIWGVIVGLTRPNGALASAALGVLALQQVISLWRTSGRAFAASEWIRPLGVRLAAASTPGLGMLGFTAYLYWLTGVPFAWTRTQEAWGREWGVRPFVQGWEWLTGDGLAAVTRGVPFDTLNTFGAIFAILMIVPVFRRLGAAYGVFVVLNLIPPLFSGGALSVGRMTSTLFPMFIALGAAVRPAAVPGWVASFAVLQGLITALFFTWREIF